jgi:TonB-linked SusC/RagA family outer membrane protein
MKYQSILFRIILFGFLLFFSMSVFGQNITLSGKVKDKKTGDPLPGVSIIEKGTQNGTTTDMEGNYKISVPEDAVLKFSMVGYQTQEIPVSGRSTLNVQLEQKIEQMEEVVVVGYGTQTKSNVTGAISKVSSEEITEMATPQSIEATLQGKASGVQIIQGSGLAGSSSVVRIRGSASVSASGDPLYVIDGVPMTQDHFLVGNSGGMNNNPLASLNPEDIASIEILKDAGSSGIYGSRGANGVILITTKRGKKGDLSFNVSSNIGLAGPTVTPELLSSQEWLQLRQEAWQNDGGTGYVWLPNYTSETSSPEAREAAYKDAMQRNTNWWDKVTQTGLKQEYNFSVSYGKEKLNTYFNLNYDKNESYLKGNLYNRISGRFNIDYNILDNLKVKLSTSYYNGINDRVNSGWAGGQGAARSTALPIYPVRNEDGSYTSFTNPVRELDPEVFQWRTSENRTIDNLTLNYNPIENLTIHAMAGIDYMDLRNDRYQGPLSAGVTNLGNASRNYNFIMNWTGNLRANYNFTVSDRHEFKLLLGSEAEKYRNEYKNVNRDDVDGPFWEDITKGDEFQENTTTGLGEEWSFLSYFTRLHYVFDDKYIFQFIARVDGSSKFGPERRFGFFPAVSGAWKITEEDFMSNISFLSTLKLRSSYGITGNANFQPYRWIGTYSPVENNYPGYNFNNITYPTNLENPTLHWEELHNFDIAVEFGLFDNRITGELAFYNKITRDVIVNRSNSLSTGFGNYWDNVLDVLNRGVEFQITSNNFTGDFWWKTSFNIARNHNEVLDLADLTPDAIGGGTNDTRIVEGESIGANYLVRFSHVDPQDGLPVWLDKNGNETKEFSLNNRVVVGDVHPDAVGGLNNTFGYKNLTLSVHVTFTIGGNIYDGSAKRQMGIVTDWNMKPGLKDRWTHVGDDASYPRLTMDASTYPGLPGPWQYNSDMFLYDATYVRLRNVRFTYKVPDKYLTLTNNTIEELRFYVSGTNLLTWSNDYWGDPEIARDFENPQDRNMSPNVTYLTPPQQKTLNFGVNLKF